MSVQVEFEDGLLQNRAIFSYLEEVKAKVPDVVQDISTKMALNDLKKELQVSVDEIDISEKKQVNELIQVFRDKNFEVWNARSELASLIKKIKEVNSDYDNRRKQEAKEAIEIAVNQANVDYKLTGSRHELNASRFMSVDSLTVKGELKKSISDKIISAALQAQANIEQEEAIEAARLLKLNQEKALAQKEAELNQREADVSIRETEDSKAMQAQLNQERANAQAKSKALENVRDKYENKQDEIISRLTALENKIDIEKQYSGKSVLDMIKKIKEMMK